MKPITLDRTLAVCTREPTRPSMQDRSPGTGWVALGLALWLSACAQVPHVSADAAASSIAVPPTPIEVPAPAHQPRAMASTLASPAPEPSPTVPLAAHPRLAKTLEPSSETAPVGPVQAGPVSSVATSSTHNPILAEWAQDASDWARTSPHVRSGGEPADIHEPRVFTDLLERIRAGYGMADLDNELVAKWVNWYASRPDYVGRMMDRGARYLFHVVEEVQKRQMPSELALLPFVESAFNPQAMSSARASGMWQFMPATGKDFELKQNIFRDDRRGVLASTRAALDYLEMLHRQFKDWQLALAAYNWGQGNVQRAIDRNRRQGLATDFASLTMPDETRNYVPKLMAVKRILSDPAAHGLTLARIDNHPYFLVVDIERDLDVRLVADLAGLAMDEFKALNPQLNKPVILAAGTPQVLLPYDNANQFIRRLKTHKGPFATWTAWVAPTALKIGEVAKRVGMSESELRDVNLIPKGMMVRAGSTLLIVRKNPHAKDVSDGIADEAHMALAPEPPEVVRRRMMASAKGETVQQFAKRHRLDARKLAASNGLKIDARLQPKQAIWVDMPAKVAKAEMPRKAGTTTPRAQVAAKSRAPAVKTAQTRPAPRMGCPSKSACTASKDGKRPVKLAKAP